MLLQRKKKKTREWIWRESFGNLFHNYLNIQNEEKNHVHFPCTENQDQIKFTQYWKEQSTFLQFNTITMINNSTLNSWDKENDGPTANIIKNGKGNLRQLNDWQNKYQYNHEHWTLRPTGILFNKKHFLYIYKECKFVYMCIIRFWRPVQASACLGGDRNTTLRLYLYIDERVFNKWRLKLSMLIIVM